MTAAALIAATVVGGLGIAFFAGVLAVLVVALWDYLRGMRIAYGATALICGCVGVGGSCALLFALTWGATRVLA